MHHLIYLSRATAPFDDKQLQELLRQARTDNAALGITGMLLYGQEQFLQVLEGEEATVHALYTRIRRDPRHRDATTFADKAVRGRAFADWSMAYHSLDPQQFQRYAGLVAPAELRLEREGLTQADQQLLQLLRTFVLPEGA